MTRILYVEDNDDNIYVITNRLGRAGFTVMVARDGEQGVAMACAERPDLILMDLRLPVIDGWEATRRIKANPATRHIPILALSAPAVSDKMDATMALYCETATFDSENLAPMIRNTYKKHMDTGTPSAWPASITLCTRRTIAGWKGSCR